MLLSTGFSNIRSITYAPTSATFLRTDKERAANIDIFFCSFLEKGAIENILQQTFGEETKINLFGRGSKHRWECEMRSRQSRIEKDENGRSNIF